MLNPYKVTEPTVISFSGGRSSGYMLSKVLEAHDGILPDDCKIIFANTGKEMPQTLDFVRDVQENWNIDIIWLERFMRIGGEEENKYMYETKVVDYETASRNGEPFASLANRPYLPNPIARFCTVELKIKAIRDYLWNTDFPKDFTAFIGIRGDEERRAAKMHGTKEQNQDRWLPMYLDGVTKEMVGDFWRSMPFDLKLPNNNGTTDWGNCDLCFLKGAKKRMSIIKERPDLATWWIEMEDKVGATFRKDEMSYKDMLKASQEQPDMFENDPDLSISCFCGD